MPFEPIARRWLRRTMTLAAWLVLTTCAAQAAGDVVQAKLREGQSLRELAKQYLGDPDLWTAILRANKLDSITDAKPGMTLIIPVAQIAKADHALADALAAIQEATKQGPACRRRRRSKAASPSTAKP